MGEALLKVVYQGRFILIQASSQRKEFGIIL